MDNTPPHTLKSRIREFSRDESGAAFILIAVCLTTLVLAVGSAIDLGRAELVEAKLSSSLDAAGLAAGASISTANYQDEAEKYFNTNYPADYIGSTVTNFNATLSEDGTKITLTATATIPTTLMRLAGIETMTVTANSEITRTSKGLELVLVIDTSGSMSYSAGGGQTRLEAVQDATEALLDILYGESDDTQENLWVGVVPFSQGVNIGTSRTSWVNSDSYDWGTDPWDGCVESRAPSGRDVTDDTPTVEKFNKYWYSCSSPYNKWYGTNGNRDNCNSGAGKQYKTGASSTTHGPNLYCPSELLALSSSKSAVSSKVNSLQAIGGTHTVLGAVWAWHMLSPNWRGLWGGEMNTNNLPLDYGTQNMDKAVIILSDGDNQHLANNYSAYNYLSLGWLGTTSSSVSDDKLDDRTEEVCDAMKDNNIIIYTIAFGTSVSSQGKALMQYCASKSDYYFESPSTSDLDTAFQTIGDSLANLRVSK